MKAPATLTAAILASTAPVALATAVLLAATPAAAQDAPPAAPNAPADTDTAADTGADRRTTFDIAAQPLSSALLDYSRQSGILVVVDPARVADKRARAVKGRHSAADALNRMLVGTGLVPQRQAQGGFTLVEARAANLPGELVAARGGGRKRVSSYGDEVVSEANQGISEILVVGSRSQNVDIRRSEDDPQPYVVFGSEEIERSGATNLEDFFRARLPMNTQAQAASQDNSGGLQSSNVSAINLRGFGVNQTLILIDGRRAPRLLDAGGYDFAQADINGIPLSAIERIEVLPSSAGGIYGGGAVGGVINIVRKRDYSGINVRTGFEGTFRGGGEVWRVEVGGGFSPDDGQTQISLAGSYMDARPLHVDDNNLWRRSRQEFIENSPNPGIVFGYTPNISSAPAFEFVPYPTTIPGAVCFPASGRCRIRTTPNLVLDDGTPLNSPRTHVPPGYAGVLAAGDGGAALVANAGLYNLELSNDAMGRKAALRNNPRLWSANLNIRHRFNGNIESYVDMSLSENRGRSTSAATIISMILPADSPVNPFQQDVVVPISGIAPVSPNINRTRQASGTVGLVAEIGKGWSLNSEYQWSQARRTYKYTTLLFGLDDRARVALENGGFDVIRDLNVDPIDLAPYAGPSPDTIGGPAVITQQIASARTSGPLVDISGGPINITALAERRVDESKISRTSNLWSSTESISPPRRQSVNSMYFEINVPITSSNNIMSFLHELIVQSSVRHDRYVTVGATSISVAKNANIPIFDKNMSKVHKTSYSIAAILSPVEGVSFRSSHSTGFLPASISQVTSGRSPGSAGSFIDPLRGGRGTGTEGDYVLVTAGNPALVPESSRSFSLGAIIKPKFVSGLRISVDYTNIEKKNEIGSISPQYIIDNEEDFPGRVVRGPNLPGDPAGFSGPIIELDYSLLNIARSWVRAWDFQVNYDIETNNSGRLHLYGVASRQSQFKRQLLPTDVPVDSIGYYDGPLEWRGNVGLNWYHGNFRAGWNTQFYDSYSIRLSSASDSTNNTRTVNQGDQRIPGQIYNDLFIGYRFPLGKGSLLDGLDLSAGVQNVFDKKPPLIATSGVVGTYSFYGDARLRRFTLTLTKHFGF